MSSDSQAHLAYLALEQHIVTLKLAPGALVTEKQLIDLTGQGRTPVREAIQKLAWEGLIAVRPRVGLQIAAIGPADHAHIMATRAVLEPMAAGLVATHATEDARERMIGLAQEMTAASIRSDREGFLVADKAFDEALDAACPNRFLMTALQPLQSHARRLWFAGAEPGRMDGSVMMHVRVIRAIHRGDAAAATGEMAALMRYLAEEPRRPSP
ncbi:GntR family transcriptional regulator [Ensifer soli]|uniref:GntR family transcriptional regulator n=1 Tax=Ciceribacter sp. sgz301302 TaxID=3342379 RepID=UPI0035BB07BD